MEDMYLSINEKIFKELRDEAKQETENIEGDEAGDDLTFPNMVFSAEETYFESGKIHHCGMFRDQNGQELGYMSVDVSINLDMLAEITSYYAKKLNKLKTVFEAMKE